MKRKGIIIGVILAIALGGGFLYRFTHLNSGGGENAEKKETGHKEENVGGHDEHGAPGSVKMAAEVQKKFGRCDILINSAGIFPQMGFDQMTFDRAIQCLRHHAIAGGGRPLFLNVAFTHPHDPLLD